MKRMLRILFASLLLIPSAMPAGLLGDWYGILEGPNGKLRLAFHFSKDGDSFQCSLDSVDQGTTKLPATKVAIDGAKITAAFAALDGKLEAEANADATELASTWTQRGRSLPLKLTRTKFTAGAAVPLTAAERDFLISHLEQSRQLFLRSIEGLTAAQWTFKPAPDRWNIAECAEHLTVTEDALFQMVTQRLLKAPVWDGIQRKTQADDEKIIAATTDRSKKGQAPEMLKPSNRFPTPAAIQQAFNPKRDRSVEFVRSTREDLRGRVSGPMDAYQYLVMMSAHTLRHTAQLNEVKADPAYPR